MSSMGSDRRPGALHSGRPPDGQRHVDPVVLTIRRGTPRIEA